MAKKNTKSRNAKSPQGKPWKEFEKLVSRIEKFMSPQGAIVTSPDKIPDLVSGTLREVDASIKFTVGSSPILIVIECRNRSTKQDVMWVEQLISKKTSVGASVLVGVSSKGFSLEAKKKAKSHGIQLRKLDKLIVEDLGLGSLLKTEKIGWKSYDANIQYYETVTNPMSLVLEEFNNFSSTDLMNDKIVFSSSNEAFFSLKEIFESYHNLARKDNNEFQDITFDEMGFSNIASLEMQFSLGDLCHRTKSGDIFIRSFTVNFKIFKIIDSIKATSQSVYLNEDDIPVAKSVEFIKEITSGDKIVYTYVQDSITKKSDLIFETDKFGQQIL